ncbi:Mu transposase C-terminal domain-containing protein [Pseudoalteromonas sp. L23]|uniref:Mu transposase C-terminal domain-containing protein n=1 Tax=unclassified Pseudoalteromonas TaxID=194690 RepID=UPI001EEF91B4|nr:MULTISPECIES: Mu transposase C-terminal domain-containing protein [unclassified Pseudoalteromonas]MCF7512981.1 Mu transposase C-terminal domain-containing protein [Pseudoalteromonas sp. L7]MCF7525021.1 Mu transposase C-terminal domain-containing protein [Pseudoalteromonas sp. L23]
MHPAVAKFKNLPSVMTKADWQSAPDTARKTAQSRAAVVKHLLTSSKALDKALETLKAAFANGTISPALHQALTSLGKLPSRATIYNWCKDYKSNGLEGLLPNHKGRVGQAPIWAARALEFYHCPNSPSFALVAKDLRDEGYDAQDFQVRRFINSMPHELGPQSPYRMGAKLYREKHKDFKLRTTAHIPSGFVYNGDGHTIDVYVAHHNSGQPFRYELTAFQDVRSRKIVSWDLSEAENSLATLNALVESIKTYQHVPAILYVDNGSGYKSNMMNDECCGVYAQLDIDTIFAIPGNARAKWIERFFRHMEEHVGRRFETYCGRGHDENFKKLVLKEIKQGKRKLPTLEQWITEFKAFLEHYNNAPHPEESNLTRNQVWEQNLLQERPITVDFDFLPKAKINVRRGQIKLHKRIYAADYLHQFNGQQLVAGFSMKSDKAIKLYEPTGEYLMTARLKTKSHAIPESRIEQRIQERKVTRLKRLAKHQREIETQAAETRVVDVASVEALAAATPEIAHQEPQTIDLNINDFAVEIEEPAGISVAEFFELEDE